jgi:hypothetical protein
VYQSVPWAIFRQPDAWLYLGISPDNKLSDLHLAARFNLGHTRGEIYHPESRTFRQGGLTSLSLFPTDQIFLAPALANFQACILHGAGLILRGQGLLFCGPSEAGKSTITTLLREEGEILCDDRIILRRRPEGFQIHGTWSHGDIPEVSSASALLRALVFLEKAETNEWTSIENPKEKFNRLFFRVIRPLVTTEWWEKVLSLLEQAMQEVPMAVLKFRKDEGVRKVIRKALLET